MKNELTNSLNPYLKGIGQIMLQESALTGFIFLIGIFLNSPLMGVAAIVSVFVGTMTAKLLKYSEDEINMGLYGFNATLIGIGLIFYFDSSIIIWVAVILLSALTTVMMNFCLRKKIPIFTFPFILLLWIAIYIYPETHHLTDAILVADAPIIPLNDSFSIMGHGLGFGEVIFQASLLSGLIFYVGVYINSPIAALYGVFGVVLSVLIAIFFKDKLDHIHNGLFAFNALLCAITFSGLKKQDIVYVITAVVLSIAIEDFMLTNDLEILTFPFVLATWITLFIKQYGDKLLVPTES